jgi:8-oxo-dGTP pyrophosphatase MutT (NUDIX family)
VLDTREVYRNPWIRVREDSVLRPDGRPGIYGVVEFEPAVGVVALGDDGAVYLVGQYRYPTDSYSWEIVTGYADAGEEPLAAAQRELREEAGLSAGSWTALGHIEISNSVTDQVGFLYLARDLSVARAAPDETEQLEVRRIPLGEALAQAQESAIFDGFSLAGLYRAWHYLRGDLRPEG